MGKLAVRKGNRLVMFSLLLAGACLLASALSVSHSAAAGNTYYASPTGVAGPCSQGNRCKIGEAIAKAGNGDTVSLATGSYELPFTGLSIEKSINLGAAPGAPAILETEETAAIEVTANADATLHDLRLEGAGGLLLGSGIAERVFVAYQGVDADACELEKGTTLRDSVCWTVETSKEDEGESHAIDISSSGENQDELVILRNVTAIADNEDGNAIHLFGVAGAELAVSAANVIARSINGTDVVAEIGAGGGFPKAHLTISNSSFGEFDDEVPDASVTPIGSAGNISAPASFLDASNGDFRVAGDSPTLDGGIADLAVSAIDLDGNDRAQAKCFGADPVPDMGAYERTPTATCPPPPPPPPPVEPRKPVFRVVNLFLNKKTGAGRLLVEVPGAGTLSLTGSGVKLIRRTAPAGGAVITLPIQTWVITKVRLAKRGKTRVKLHVIFEAKGGRGIEEWSKGVLLRKKRS
jgi:hypothetical protein